MPDILRANPDLPAYIQMPVGMELLAILHVSRPDTLAHAATEITFMTKEISNDIGRVLNVPASTPSDVPRVASIRGNQVVENLKAQLQSFKSGLSEQGTPSVTHYVQDGLEYWTISFTLNPNGDITKKYEGSGDISHLVFEVTLDNKNQMHLPTAKPEEEFILDVREEPDPFSY